jgi:hypothetical protein
MQITLIIIENRQNQNQNIFYPMITGRCSMSSAGTPLRNSVRVRVRDSRNSRELPGGTPELQSLEASVGFQGFKWEVLEVGTDVLDV